MAGHKIALVYDAIYPYIKGGAERRYYELALRLTQQGYDVHLYGMKFWEGPDVITRDGLTLHGIMKARPLYTADGRRSISQAVLFGFASWKMLGEKFDILDCCGFPYFSLFPARVVAWVKRKPLFVTWHEVWGKKYWKEYLGKLGAIGYLVEKTASMLPDRIISCSDLTTGRLLNDLRVKAPIHTIANGVDVQHISKLKPAAQTSDVSYAGRLVSHKNVDLLIKAISVLKQRGIQLKCSIIGDGPESKKLQALAKKLKVSKQITFHGFIPESDDAFGIIKASKVFVLPSEREGFGFVAIEANALGVPVLTLDHTDNAATGLITPGKNGALFSKNPEALADAIGTMLLQTGSQLSATCVKSSRVYDWTVLTKQVQAVYEDR
jgi:glycosyltransferase involved in cell wall biosynthesis